MRDESSRGKRVVPTEIWARVVGYYQPVKNWNPGKQQEFKERRNYDKVFKEETHASKVG